QSGGIELLAQGGEATDILEQYADFQPLTAQRNATREHRLGDVSRDESTERVLDVLAIPQTIHHLVERARQETDLVTAIDLSMLPQVSGKHRAHRAHQGSDRLDDSAGEQGTDE